MPSERQIGIKGEREPDLCAVTGRDVRGKHAVTHYGPNGQYVYVLAQVDHLWPQAAPAYGFPVTEEKPAQAENLFVLEGNDENAVIVPTGDNTQGSFQAGSFPAGNFASVRSATPRAPKASTTQPDIKADGMSKGDD